VHLALPTNRSRANHPDFGGLEWDLLKRLPRISLKPKLKALDAEAIERFGISCGDSSRHLASDTEDCSAGGPEFSQPNDHSGVRLY
jgi:hypothetical protein